MTSVKERLHVVTLVDRTGDGEFDPVSFGSLNRPAPGAEGANTEALLGHVDNYACDGQGDGTNGCTTVHRQAVERVIARVQDDGRVAVTWRCYHPRVASGYAEPGAPFEATDPRSGYRVRVEVREVDGRETTDQRIPPEQVVDYEGALQQSHATFAVEEQMDQQLRTAAFALEKDAGHWLDAEVQALAAVIDAALLAGLTDQAASALRGAVTGLRRGLQTGAVDVQQNASVQRATHEAQQQVDAALSPLRALREQAEAATQMRHAILAALNGLEASYANLGQRPSPATADALEEARGLAEAPLAAEIEAIEPQLSQLNEASQFLDGLVLELNAQLAELEAQRAEQAARIDSLAGWTRGDNQLPWHSYISVGQSFPGFSVRHWSEQFDAVASELKERLQGALDSGLSAEPPSSERLRELEAAVTDALGPFYERLNAELTRRSEGRLRTVPLAGRDVGLPLASVRVLEAQRGGLRVEAEVRSTDAQPMVVALEAASGHKVTFPVLCEGEVGRVVLDWAQGPFTFRVEMAADADGRPWTVNVELDTVHPKLAGAHLYAPHDGARVVSAVAAFNRQWPVQGDGGAVVQPERLPGLSTREEGARP